MSYEGYAYDIDAYRHEQDVRFHTQRRREETETLRRRLAEIKARGGSGTSASLCAEMREACEETRMPAVCREDEDFAEHCVAVSLSDAKRSSSSSHSGRTEGRNGKPRPRSI